MKTDFTNKSQNKSPILAFSALTLTLALLSAPTMYEVGSSVYERAFLSEEQRHDAMRDRIQRIESDTLTFM